MIKTIFTVLVLVVHAMVAYAVVIHTACLGMRLLLGILGVPYKTVPYYIAMVPYLLVVSTLFANVALNVISRLYSPPADGET